MALLNSRIEDKALAAAQTLSRLGIVRAVYLFGSQAEGNPGKWSDIDVAAFMEGIEGWDIVQRAKAMALVMEEAGSDVEAHLFPASSLEKPKRGSFAEFILQHGIRIAQ